MKLSDLEPQINIINININNKQYKRYKIQGLVDPYQEDYPKLNKSFLKNNY